MDILVLLPYILTMVHGSVIEFTATPSEIKDGLSPSLVLRCSLTDSSSSGQIVGRRDVTQTVENMAEVTSLVVMHDGQDLASVSHLHTAHQMSALSNVRVNGSVSPGAAEKGFIEVNFEFPSQEQMGEFQCEVNAVSDSGHVVTFSRSLEVEVTQPSTGDLVTFVREMSLALKTKEQTLEKEISNMKAKELLMQQQITELQSHSHPGILFSVGISKDLTIPAGQVVIYDKIYTNLGGDYSPNTGMFNCSTGGYYMFSLSALSDYNKVFWLDVLLNNQHQFAIYGPASHSHQGTSNSAILRLSPGDQVTVVAVYQSTVTDRPDEIYSTFNGHLLAKA